MDNIPDNSQRSLTFVNLCVGLRRVQVMNKERLAKLKKSLAPSVNVCDHIANSVMNNNYSFEIFPIYTCIGFNHTVFWCCENCQNKYHVPSVGAYIVFKEELLVNESHYYTFKAKDYENGDNPFDHLISNEINSGIKISDLEIILSNNENKKNIKQAVRIPFGAVLTSHS